MLERVERGEEPELGRQVRSARLVVQARGGGVEKGLEVVPLL